MIPVSEKQAVLFCQGFWGGKANLSVKNVILTWGSLQVLHTWELFDCTVYNYINSELSLGSWLMNMHHCDLFFFFLIHQNTFHPRVTRSFTQQSLWVDFMCYHTLHWKGNKLIMALNGMCAVAKHLLSCVQLVCVLLTPCKALMVRTTIRAELLKYWYARAFMLN